MAAGRISIFALSLVLIEGVVPSTRSFLQMMRSGRGLLWKRGAALVLACLALPVAAVPPEAPLKVLRYILPAAETSLDPATGRDLYTGHITEAIFERLYTYDYLARPVKLAPQTAAALPEVSADGKTYLIHLAHGQYFTPDPAFKGKRRELTVADYVYSWKRLFDPKLASPNTWLLEGKVIGLDDLAKDAKRSGKFDYDKPVAGLEVLDPYTLRIHLNNPDFNLGMILAYDPLSAVAREVVEAYGDSKGEVASNPVGTGYYQLAEWVRGSRIVLDENKRHLPAVWNFQPGDDPDDQRIVRQMRGKKIPQIGRIEITVQLEDQSRWLSFTSGGADLFWLDGPLAPKALLNGKLRPELAARGIQLSRIVDPDLTYYYWNMLDPVVGGMSKPRIALRRAIAMAHDIDEEIQLVLNGEGQRLDYPIPPGVVGHAGRDRIVEPLPLAVQHQLDFLVDVVGHGDGAAQRDARLAHAADHRVQHVPVIISQVRVDDARQLDAARGQLGPQLAVQQRLRRQRAVEPEQVGAAAGEGQPARLVLQLHGDFDAADLRDFLAPHLAHDALVVRVVAGLEVPHGRQMPLVLVEHDAAAAHPLGQLVIAGADRIRRDLALAVAIGLDHLARHGRQRVVGQDHAEVEVRIVQVDAQRVRVEHFQAGDRLVVVELAAALGLLGQVVETDHFAFKQPGVGRGQLGVEQPLPRIDVVGHGQLAALALEGRVRRKVLAVGQADQIGLAVGRHLRQGDGRLRRQLDGAGQVIVGVEPLEDGFGDVAGVQVAAGGRVEAGFGGRQDVAQHFERRLGRDGRDRQGQTCQDQSCAALPQ